MQKKILIEYNYILHYRKPLFNILSSYYDVTVLHSGEKSVLDCDKYKEIITPVKKIGSFYYQQGILNEIRREYDIIIILFDIRWINSLICMPFHHKKAKTILWGAWITKNLIANKIRIWLSNRVFANVFYTYASKKDFIDTGVINRNLYVANNTFHVDERIRSFESLNKDSILFVGSLDRRKQNDILLKSFANIITQIPSNINLRIIGEGSELKNLKNIVEFLGLKNRVEFIGKITETKILKNYYKSAIVSVSFGQAGLSVLQSLGYGVPFLTKKNAISGGEIFNVKHGVSGILCEDSIDSLDIELSMLCNNIAYARKLGEQAWYYYGHYCTMENMAQGFIDAIEGTNIANIDTNTY